MVTLTEKVSFTTSALLLSSARQVVAADYGEKEVDESFIIFIYSDI
jgi:hypothetical protein